jgi:S-DNA-T family DNA segregation ATPase FtsK/SpoIIIE
MGVSRLLTRFKQDISGIIYLGAGVFIALSLLSFNPNDPSFNSIGVKLKVMNYCGYVGSFMADGLYQLFGLSAWLIAVALFRFAFVTFKGEAISLKDFRLIWASLLIITLSSLTSVYAPETKIFQQQIYLGGIVGVGISSVLIKVLNLAGVQVFLWSMAAILVVFYSERPLKELMAVPIRFVAEAKRTGRFSISTGFLKDLVSSKASKKQDETVKKPLIQQEEKPEKPIKPLQLALKLDHEEVNLEPTESPEEIEEISPVNSGSPQRRKVVLKAKVIRKIENWELPKISLLEDPPATRFKIDEREIRRKAETLTDKLGQFAVTGEVVAAKPGPAVTMFEFKPSANVRVSKITELADDLSLALSSESLRIIAPIPGRDVVGIETSNAQRETVYLKDMLAHDDFWKEEVKLPLALGKQANGDPRIVDLRKMPHLMVAGTTGSGKSVFVVSVITGLLFKHSPKTLKLILIDPKQVDLAAFEKVPHLAVPLITETRQAVTALKWAVREMEKRYRSMNRFGARGLEAFNESVAKLNKEQIEEHDKINQELEQTPGKKGDQYYFSPLPYIVIVVEEFGDLMTVDKANVETAVVRLAQMARACGIHLVLAMQSPRKEVVTGLIKTNIPGRISFKVNSSMDSRIILDETGAERLLAQGDMLYKSPGGSSLIRHHGPFLKDAEISEVAKFWSVQGEPDYDTSAMKAMENISSSGEGGESSGFSEEGSEEQYDDRYDEILSWASTQKEISASLIQRRFQLGYPRAARIVETFEREGVVGPANGSKPRQVLVNNLNHLVD